MSQDNKPAKNDKTTHKPNKGNEKARQPDPETLGTTDPQEHMKGPVSSAMQKIKKEVQDNDDDDREEVRREPDEKKR